MLQLEELERVGLAERQVAATLAAAGRLDGDLPTLRGQRAAFDEWLAAEPVHADPVDVEERELREVLGVS